jgi:hypothetical protein
LWKRTMLGALSERFENRSATAQGGVANFFNRKRFVTKSLLFRKKLHSF